MYVDDVSTLKAARGKGFADELMRWVIGEAQHRQCEEIHLDSGVGSDRGGGTSPVYAQSAQDLGSSLLS